MNTQIGKVMGQAVEESGNKEAVNGYPNPNNHASSAAGNLLNCWVHGIHFPEKVRLQTKGNTLKSQPPT